MIPIICLDNTDVIEGGANIDAVIDYTMHGLVGTTFTQLAAGVMNTTLTTVLYTAGAAMSVVSIILVNKHTSAADVTLCLDPANAGNPRRLIPKTVSLGAGYSLHTDGARITVMDASGNIVTSYGVHAANHQNGGSDEISVTGLSGLLADDQHVLDAEVQAVSINNIVEDTSPQLGGFLDPNSHYIGRAKGGDIASASPLVIDTDGDYFDVTGTTGFAAMTVAANRHFFLQFDGILTMTHHATNLDLPGEANITTAAGDVGEFFSTGANTVQCVNYTRAVSATAFNDIKQAASTTATGVVEIATNTETVAFESESLAVTPESLGYAMAGHLAYGIEYDDDEPSPTLTRIGALSGIAAGSSPGNACLPIQAKMRRCLMADDGTVNYYLDASDSTKKEDGVTASVLTGADGQVMVEIPKFYHSYTYNATTHKHQRLISSVQLPGFTLHPAFWKNGAEVDFRYIGAYEGVGYDHGTSAYFDGDDVGDTKTQWPGGTAIDTANDKLSSVSGFAPLVNETRAEFRAIAGNRGGRQQDFSLAFAVQLLTYVEYASFDIQSMIGMGRTEISGGTWAKDSYIGVTGKSNGDGNGTNSVGGNTNNAYMTYRGIENFYGNVWKWVDGFNINGGIPYVSNDDTDFADDTATGAASTYSRLKDINGDGITLPQGSNDYQKNLAQIKNGILPSTLEGSSSTYITDYYYQNSGWRVAALGGNAYNVLLGGVASWFLHGDSAADDVNVSGRLSLLNNF